MKSLRLYPIFAAILLTATGVATLPLVRAQSATVATASNAVTAKAYKTDAARHIYKSDPEKIYKGKLPALVHAIVVLVVFVDAHGNVHDINTILVTTQVSV